MKRKVLSRPDAKLERKRKFAESMGMTLDAQGIPVPPDPHYRQLDFYDPGQYDPCVLVVGAGGIGSPLVMMLSKLGVRRITLMDDDRVSVHNFSTTTFSTADVGKPKVGAVKALIKYFGYPTKIHGMACKFTSKMTPMMLLSDKDKKHGSKFDVVFSAVDSAKVREDLFKWSVKNKVHFFVDGRIGAENYRVYAVNTKVPGERKKYLRSLIAAKKNPAPLPCTGQQVIDVGWTVAAAMTRALRQWFAEARYVPEAIVKIDRLEDVVHGKAGMIYAKAKDRKLFKGEHPKMRMIRAMMAELPPFDPDEMAARATASLLPERKLA